MHLKEVKKKQACTFAENALLQMFFQELGQNLQNSYLVTFSVAYEAEASGVLTRWCSLTL